MAKQSQKIATAESRDDTDLRNEMLEGDGVDLSGYEDKAVSRGEVSENKIFGLSAVERMILSIVLFLTVTVLGVALLFMTGTIAIR